MYLTVTYRYVTNYKISVAYNNQYFSSDCGSVTWGWAHLNWILLESSAQPADPTELGSLL